MKKTRITKVLTAAALSAAMVMSMGGMTAFAEEPVTINKDLVVPAEANVPDVSFSFTIEGSDARADGGEDEIKTGVGNLTIEDADFDVTDKATIGDDGLYRATKSLTVNIPDGTYTQPGVYRYEVTEGAAQGAVAADITNDSVSKKYLDIFVKKVDDKCEVYGSRLVNDLNGIDDKNGKAKSFENTYTTYDLDLTKHVTGDMGETDYPFEFTVEFSGPVNTTFTVGGTGYEEDSVTLVGEKGESTGTATMKVNLADAETLELSGIPSCVEYTITETNPGKGYSTTNVIDGDWQTVEFDGENDYSTEKQTMTQKDHKVDFVNNRNAGDIPATGIILNFAPYILLVAFAGVFAVLFLRKRREEF